ncbi:MAG: ATP-binding protein [Acidobacteriaceae bacterium]|jgi:two-component system, OmpR family, sensor histidine kinase CpxA
MKLSVKIFLSFWIASILMIVLVTTAADLVPLNLRMDHGLGFEPDATRSELTDLLNRYEGQGRAALALALKNRADLLPSQVFLFDREGNVVAGDGTPPAPYGYLAREAIEQEHEGLQRILGLRMLYVCPLQGPSGKHYAAVITLFEPGARLLKTRFWVNITLAMFPAALICIALSLYITRPITRLRATAQRLAAGNLGARSSPHRVRRRDELGDLARDFDIMAGQIERLMSAQRRFVADVSHELGAPLTRLHLALALLRRQFARENTPELERIERETDKLSKLVQQLLLLAGLESNRLPAETLTRVSLRSLCENAIEDANVEAAHANCVVAGTRQDAILLAYPHLLQRAVDNVLRNAIRYTQQGSEICLNCRIDDEHCKVIIDVLDSGPGVPESMLVDIFQPFFRTSPGREIETGGTGLGLAIASEAVRLHEGTITARNRESGGLQVTITLPIRTPSPDQELHDASASSMA